jgi:hypothetical protein
MNDRKLNRVSTLGQPSDVLDEIDLPEEVSEIPSVIAPMERRRVVDSWIEHVECGIVAERDYVGH